MEGKHDIHVFLNVIDSKTHRFVEKEVFDKDIVIYLKDLSDILQVSKPTISRLKELGIITVYEEKPSIMIDGDKYKYDNRYGWLQCYNLNIIKERITSYILSK